MSKITRHSKIRMVQRDKDVENAYEAKKTAKQAKSCGKTINHFQRYPKFFKYLQNKTSQTNTCSVRIYHGNIYIWRGKKTKALVTVHPIPARYMKEIEQVDLRLKGEIEK